jgi:methyl-accepting chemotaxis protein
MVADMVSAAAVQMEATAKSMVETSSRNNSCIGDLVDHSTSASENVNNIAHTAKNLSVSINEIEMQMRTSDTITRKAVEKTNQANETIIELSKSTSKIGDIVTLINAIAEQINLLALNATIEAARAGDAGKGFAVVASEVKNLANQTAIATEEISQQISAIQDETMHAVDFIKNISDIVTELNTISNAISHTVKDQGVATNKIVTSISSAAQGVQDVSKNAENVLDISNENARSINEMLGACSELTKQSTILNTEVDNFLHIIQP